MGLAARGESLSYVGLVMLLFGSGAAITIAMIGMLSLHGLQRMRGHLLHVGQGGKRLLGGSMLIMGILILTGTSRRLEAALLDISPEWLLQMSTAI